MNDDLNKKIEDLEVRISFQEAAISELSDQVALQAKENVAQEKHIQLLNEKLNSLLYELEQGQKGGGDTAFERPPHY